MALRAGMPSNTVSSINKGLALRTRERTEEISRDEILKKQAARQKPKINFFSEKEKLALLEEHKGGLIRVARKWWSNRFVRAEAGDFDTLLNEIRSYAFEKLDEYDPAALGKDGKPTKIITWLMESAKFCCLSMHSKAKRRLKRQVLARID
jgi:hypothetical protein